MPIADSLSEASYPQKTMPTDPQSVSDSQFEEMFANFIAASERCDQREMDALLAANSAFAERVRGFAQFEISLQGNLLQNPAESNDVESNDNDQMCSSYDYLVQESESFSFPRPYGNYELIDVIGEGGMGIVYKAKQLRLRNRIVALKVSRIVEESWPGRNAASSARFQTEIDVAAKLDHPNIVPVFESGRYKGRHFISMKLIEGTSLQAVPPASQLDEVRRLILIADAAQHAHDRGVLHRDLKPQNVIVDNRGVPYVSDFGLAKLLESSQSVTRTGVGAGTPQYMSPEQANGSDSLTVATDIYSLGVILFERICGRPLYNPESAVATVNKVRFGARPNLRLLNVKGDRDLRAIILKCLEFLPSDRYESCRALKRDLELWQLGEPLESRSVNSWQRVIRWARRHPARSIAGVTLIALSLATLALMGIASQARWRYRVTEYGRNVQLIRAELSENRPGWKERVYQSLKISRPLASSNENRVELSSLKANCDIGFDIGKTLFSVDQEDTVAIKFHPTKPLLFIARKYADEHSKSCPILVVDTKTGKTIHQINVSDPDATIPCEVRALEIVSDGDWLTLMTTESKLIVYSLDELESGRVHVIVPFPRLKFMNLVAVDGTGALILAGRTVDKQVWQISSIDTKTWSVFRTRELPEGLTSMVQASDLKRLIICDYGNRLQVIDPVILTTTWGTIDVQTVGNIDYHKGRVAVNSGASVRIYDVQSTGKMYELAAPPGGFSHSHSDSRIVFSSGGDFIASGDKERNQVHIWAADGTYLQSMTVDAPLYHDAKFDFSSDGLFALTGRSKTIVVPIRPSAITQLFSSQGPLVRIIWAKDRAEVFALSRLTSRLTTADLFRVPINSENGTPSSRIQLKNIPEYSLASLMFSPDERRLAVGIAEGNLRIRIQVIDTSSMEVLGTTPVLNEFRSAAFDCSGRLLATANSGILSFTDDFSKIHRCWIRPQLGGSSSNRSEHHPLLQRIDDEHLFVGDEDGWLTKLYWCDSPKPISSIRLGPSPLRAATIHPTLGIMAVGDGNGNLYLVSTESGQLLLQQSAAHWSGVSDLAWTPSGYLISAGLDQSLQFWKWNSVKNRLEGAVRLRLRGNACQVIPIGLTNSKKNLEDILILREGSRSVERLTVDLSCTPD